MDDPRASTAPFRFRACTLVDGLLIGQVLELGGVHVVPVPGAGAVRGHAAAANAALDGLGWSSRLSADRHQDDPAVVCLPESETHAGPVAHAGNLLTGFLFGEDPETLRRYAAAAQQPVVALWLALAREATAQRTSEAQLFRYAQLLEIVAGSHVPVDRGLADDGSPLAWRDGSTTRVARSNQRRILVLLRDAAARRQVHLPSLLPPGLTDVWLGVRCLVGVRDAVAHHGGFDPDSPAQQAQKWYDDVAELMAAGRAAEPLLDPRDHLAQSAREMTRLVLAGVVDDALAARH